MSRTSRASPERREEESLRGDRSPWIPPPSCARRAARLRPQSNDGLPGSSTVADLRGDLHIRTLSPPMAKTTCAAMAAQRPAKRDSSYLAITDHSEVADDGQWLDERRALAHASRHPGARWPNRRRPSAGRRRVRHQAGRNARPGRRLPRRTGYRRRAPFILRSTG